jgi:hypothetical protein
VTSGRLLDHTPGEPVTLWRLHAADGSGELACLNLTYSMPMLLLRPPS